VTAPTVTAVLVTFYGTTHLERLWASPRVQRYPGEPWRLIVVENGPERAAARWFAEHAPGVRVRVPGDNNRYAGATRSA
jgi:hypothetical protein